MNLPPLTQSFVLHFGEMGSRWGISRTVGQIYVHDTTSDAVTARIDAVMRAGVGTVIALLIAVFPANI